MNKKRKNILIITSSYPISPGDFQGNFIEQQVNSLEKKGYRILVLTPYINGSNFIEKRGTITIYRFPYFFPIKYHRLCSSSGMYFGFQNSILGKLQTIPYVLALVFFTGFIIRKEKISLIHTHWIIPQGLAGSFWRLITGIPHITTSHVLDVSIAKQIPVLKILIEYVLKNCDSITVNSNYTKGQLDQYNHFSHPISVIPMGFNSQKIHSAAPKFNKDSKISILFVGRLIIWKGVDTLIYAINHIKDIYPGIELIIIGDGPERLRLETLAKNLGLIKIVRFTGKVSDDILNRFYDLSQIFVLPSKPHEGIVMEGLGVVLLEAMASGVPVIGSNIGGIPDIITDGVNGLLVPPGDPETLAFAMMTILDNPDLAEKFAQEGLRTVKDRFSWDKISDQFIEVYQEVLHESNEL